MTIEVNAPTLEYVVCWCGIVVVVVVVVVVVEAVGEPLAAFE
jgi:hypothetical protein